MRHWGTKGIAEEGRSSQRRQHGLSSRSQTSSKQRKSTEGDLGLGCRARTPMGGGAGELTFWLQPRALGAIREANLACIHNVTPALTRSLQPFSCSREHSANGRAKNTKSASFAHPLPQTHFRRTLRTLCGPQNTSVPAPSRRQSSPDERGERGVSLVSALRPDRGRQ